MGKIFEKLLSRYTKEELKILINEINNYDTTGILPPNAKVRELRRAVINICEIDKETLNHFDIDCKAFTIPQIYKEITRRYFK